MATVTIQKSLDRRGKTITTFVVFDVVAQLETMDEGEVLELFTDDYEPLRTDIAAWCEASGHVLLSAEAMSTGTRFLIEKRPPKAKDTSMAMVISNPGLEELLSPLGFALAAALEGIQVHLFLQGPAVRVLVDGFRPKLTGWYRRPFSRFAASGLTKTGHIPAQDKIRQLRSLDAEVYLCAPSMEHFKVDPEKLIFDDLPIVEYLTFMSVMEGADIPLYI